MKSKHVGVSIADDHGISLQLMLRVPEQVTAEGMCGSLNYYLRSPWKAIPTPELGFNEDHKVGASREGGSVKRSHRAEGRNWVD
jgi:hypothetical protein